MWSPRTGPPPLRLATLLYMPRTSSICAEPVLCQSVRLKLAAEAEEQGKDVKQRSGKGQFWIMPCSAS